MCHGLKDHGTQKNLTVSESANHSQEFKAKHNAWSTMSSSSSGWGCKSKKL